MAVMKVSELLEAHPHLDMEIDVEGKLTLDAVFIVRLLDPEGDQGDGIINIQSSEHTDAIVKRGMLGLAMVSMNGRVSQDDG